MNGVSQIEISVAEVVRMMRVNGRFQGPLNQAIVRKATAQSAKEAGIAVSDAELQEAVDEFRFARGLEKKQDMQLWLKSRGLSLDDLESHLETDLLIEKFKDALEQEAREAKDAASRQARPATREVIYSKWLAEQFGR